MSNLEIQGGPFLPTGAAGSADRGVGRDPFTDIPEQALVVSVQAHIAISVIDDE